MKLRAVRWVNLGLSCLFLVGGCQSNVSNPNRAYPTASAVSASAKRGERADLRTLELGRKIYTTSCTECHVARIIANYSVPEWRRWLSVMAPKAHLASADRAALETYVIGARESLEHASE